VIPGKLNKCCLCATRLEQCLCSRSGTVRGCRLGTSPSRSSLSAVLTVRAQCRYRWQLRCGRHNMATNERLISEWYIGKDLEGSDRSLILRYCTGIRPEGWGKPRKLHSGWLVSGPKLEPGTSRIRSRNVNRSTTTFGETDHSIPLCRYWEWMIFF
jgi:hypothetical protein